MSEREDAASAAKTEHPVGQLYQRYFTKAGEDPFETVEWARRDVTVGNFSQSGVEAPTSWMDQSVGVVAKLYFATVDDVREDSVKSMIRRVVLTFVEEMRKLSYFGEPARPDMEALQTFQDELIYALLHQYLTFNSPVWFNIGVPGREPYCSACYLLSTEDKMVGKDSITDWWTKESIIFKSGAGSGINLSPIRGSMEPLSTGGVASGPVAYMRPADAGAGTLKSGGAHRRAAKFVRLDDDHPDIQDFVDTKLREDARMQALIAAGFDLDPTTLEGERNIAECTSFQNANISVGVHDAFMEMATGELGDSQWPLVARKTGQAVEYIDAAELLEQIANAAWSCGDPGVQFHDTINDWHTTPSLGPITTSNPCLTEDTLIDTSEGRISIGRLATMYASGERLPMTFAWDTSEALPVLRQIRRAWATKMVDEIVEVRTTKGAVIRCTPDHPILTREGGRGPDGPYVSAGDLRPGDRLRKVARWINEQRSSRRCINHRETEAAPNGTVYQSRLMWEQAYGPIPAGMDVHHVNEDPTDDRLSNFELADVGAHQSFHSTAERNGRFIHASEESLVEFWEECEQLPNVRSATVTQTRWNLHVQRRGLIGQIPMSNGHGRIRGMSWEEFATWIGERRSLVNDSVDSVERISLSEPTPVYDLEVDGTHNFAVATEGIEHTIIVHNCGETLLNDDSSCNIASLNVAKYVYWDDDGERFDTDAFCHHVDILITAMDASCSFSKLPTDRIRRNTRDLRQLGMGYANLGSALMIQGMPYDSDEGRDFAAAVTALMTGRAYRRSALLADELGPFLHWGANNEDMMRVIDKHIDQITPLMSGELWDRARIEWETSRGLGREFGYRNSQVTLLAPTGTTSFMLGCDTTGVEPPFSLVSHKSLAGGGTMKIVNGSVERALYHLGYDDTVIRNINVELNAGADMRQFVRPEHVRIFQAAVGEDAIEPLGHVRMVAAVQPFLSQGVSKTVNMAEECTAGDVKDVYEQAWRLGLKSISIYRDNSKATQVLRSTPKLSEIKNGSRIEVLSGSAFASPDPHAPVVHADEIETGIEIGFAKPSGPQRHRLPRERDARIIKFSIDGHEGYLHAGCYEDGRLGEIFLSGIGKDGSTLRGVCDAFATDFSIAIQYGVPLKTLVSKHSHVNFPPSGPTGDPDVPMATSIVDYIARKLAAMFLSADICEELGVLSPEVKRRMSERLSREIALPSPQPVSDGQSTEVVMPHMASMIGGALPLASGSPQATVVTQGSNGNATTAPLDIGAACRQCGASMQRTGTCWSCPNCFATTGCG